MIEQVQTLRYRCGDALRAIGHLTSNRAHGSTFGITIGTQSENDEKCML